MTPEDLKPLLVAHARPRLLRVAEVVAARIPAGLTEDEARNVLAVELESAVNEALAAVLNDLRDLDDA